MSNNVFATFRRLLPQPVEQIGKVLSAADGQCVIELLGGGIMTVRGAGMVDQYVHIRDGIIVADALAPIGTEHEE